MEEFCGRIVGDGDLIKITSPGTHQGEILKIISIRNEDNRPKTGDIAFCQIEKDSSGAVVAIRVSRNTRDYYRKLRRKWEKELGAGERDLVLSGGQLNKESPREPAFCSFILLKPVLIMGEGERNEPPDKQPDETKAANLALTVRASLLAQLFHSLFEKMSGRRN